jgi:hypothetical protein
MELRGLESTHENHKLLFASVEENLDDRRARHEGEVMETNTACAFRGMLRKLSGKMRRFLLQRR